VRDEKPPSPPRRTRRLLRLASLPLALCAAGPGCHSAERTAGPQVELPQLDEVALVEAQLPRLVDALDPSAAVSRPAAERAFWRALEDRVARYRRRLLPAVDALWRDDEAQLARRWARLRERSKELHDLARGPGASSVLDLPPPGQTIVADFRTTLDDLPGPSQSPDAPQFARLYASYWACCLAIRYGALARHYGGLTRALLHVYRFSKPADGALARLVAPARSDDGPPVPGWTEAFDVVRDPDDGGTRISSQVFDLRSAKVFRGEEQVDVAAQEGGLTVQLEPSEPVELRFGPDEDDSVDLLAPPAEEAR